MSKIRRIISLVVVASMALGATACSSTNNENGNINEEEIAAKVNDQVITQKEFDTAVEYYKEYVEYNSGEGAWDTEVQEGVTLGDFYSDYIIENLISTLLLVDASEKEGITVSDEELQTQFENYKANFASEEEYNTYLETSDMTEEYLLDELKKEQMITKYLEVKIENLEPTDKELSVIFDDLKLGEKVRASHILVETEEEANTVLDRLDGGEIFEDLAKEISVDGSAANGGDLDYFAYTDMVQPFSDKAFSMEIGDVSEPVKSEFGYHIIKLTDKTKDETVTLESQKSLLTEYYKSFKYEELLEKLKDEAIIEIK
ncbi:peptidylprolyl isomerase [Sedimentibacter sp. MB31-C6]|uniref:peptidylprolyl isomerase n=1 Tax=Sedimentibacter sp. MB31-C6 TaxID=3109366 RepID=UPI002DDD4218|nr:peptidylprolyl isomerase [Sedimentibacter sp. MB36-C1]WSI03984.1 peptidylprolyl isomerase [Sedimentibacter sp. MB36-C1]